MPASTQRSTSFLAHQVIDSRDRLLVRRGAGVEDVAAALLAFVLHRIEQEAVELLENRQHRFARHRSPAAEHRRDLSFGSSSRAFSANSGQLEAGSTTTASSFLPSRPPFLFWSSISISMTSFSVVSLIAIVPDSECSTPTLIVPPLGAAAGARVCACARGMMVPPVPAAASVAAAAPRRPRSRRERFVLLSDMRLSPRCRTDAALGERISNSRARMFQRSILDRYRPFCRNQRHRRPVCLFHDQVAPELIRACCARRGKANTRYRPTRGRVARSGFRLAATTVGCTNRRPP